MGSLSLGAWTGFLQVGHCIGMDMVTRGDHAPCELQARSATAPTRAAGFATLGSPAARRVGGGTLPVLVRVRAAFGERLLPLLVVLWRLVDDAGAAGLADMIGQRDVQLAAGDVDV